MTLGGWSWANYAQLIVAGAGFMLAMQQGVVWRWEGPKSTARVVVPAALAMAALSVINFMALDSLSNQSEADAWLFARWVAIGLLALSILSLTGSLVGERPPRWLLSATLVVIVVSSALWPSSRLIYRHQFVHGLPSYGSLNLPAEMAIIAIVFGYLCFVALRGRFKTGRSILTLGVAGSLLVALASSLAPESVGSEIGTGYVTLPALVALAGLLWARQTNAFELARRLGRRQQALAELGRLALSSDPTALKLAASQVLTGQSREDHYEDGEFAQAVEAITESAAARYSAYEEMERRATTDELTGLPNRLSLLALIDRAIAACRRNGSTVAVAMCDIDRLRRVNDVYGHEVGDQILRTVAARLRGALQVGETVGRFGGDVFVLLHTGVNDSDELTELGTRLSRVFDRTDAGSQAGTAITASVGIATFTPGLDTDADAKTLLRDADTAMNDAKSRGGAGIGQFDERLRSGVVYRADLERRLIGAVDRGEIVVHYQPIVALRSGRLVGFEALARWENKGVLMPPLEWIPVAESTGLIDEVGSDVLRQATAQLKEWSAAAGRRLRMSVNVSARQLATDGFLEAVARHTEGLPRRVLTVEVTESLAVDDHAVRMLQELRKHGTRVALDDFGTGYSALAAVSRLPVDELKIDQSIIRRVDHRDGRAIVTAALGIARSLRLSTVAEGIEMSTAQDALIEMGCVYGQGYLFGRPLTAETAGRLVTTALSPAEPQPDHERRKAE